MASDRSRRNIKPLQRFGYAYLIGFALILASGFLDEEPRDDKEAMRSKKKEGMDESHG